MPGKRFRVAQWGTGNIGLYALRAIIEHPDFDLVGVRVYSAAKAGRDAGDLCGLPPTGIIATSDIAEIIAARPDCVLYMPDRAEIDALCQLLAAGINIATPRMEFNYRELIEPEMRRALEVACEAGQSSLYASGSTPGFFTEVMPLALSMMERRIDCIHLHDYCDMASRNSPEMLFGMLPFGRDPATLTGPVGTGKTSPPTMSFTAAALGHPADEIVSACAFALTRNRVTIAAGTLEKGTIGAMQMDIAALHKGRPIFKRRSTWYLTRDLDQDWELYETGVHFRVEGDLPLNVVFTIPVSDEDYPKISPAMTANPVVNAVPYICAAPPGIRHTDELPLVIGRFAPR